MSTCLKHSTFYLFAWLLTCSTASAKPRGVVVSIGQELPPLVKQARSFGGARWTGETVEQQKPQELAFAEQLDAARRAYLDADFLRCLSIGREIDRDAPLASGNWRAAGQVIMLTAACAHGADRQDEARSLIEQALIQKLDEDSKLRTRPDFDELYQKVRKEIRARPPVEVTIRSSPSAMLMVNGRQTCYRTPCTLKLPYGEHHFLLRRIGVGQRALRRRVPPSVGKVEMSESLDLLDRATASAQLAIARPASPGFAAAAALTFGAQVVAVVWRGDSNKIVKAAVYDRARDTIVGRGKAASGVNALKAALLQWQPRSGDKPFYKRPVFYVPAIVATAIATGLIIYFATREPERRAELVFP